VIVSQRMTRTPLLVGRDPFERFPGAEATSIGSPDAASLRPHPAAPGSVMESIAALVAALTPTASSQPSVAVLISNLAERFQVTLANFTESLPLLRYRQLPPAGIGLPEQQPTATGSAVRALAATADLSQWLGMTEEQIADLAGFSRRNYSNWRAGQGSYLKTVRQLFEIHALVGGLTTELGADGATAWLALPSRAGKRSRELLATSDGRAQLLSEAQALLFARPERELPSAEFEDEHAGSVSESHRKAAEVIARMPPNRRRRPR